jgi:hypothetical protein
VCEREREREREREKRERERERERLRERERDRLVACHHEPLVHNENSSKFGSMCTEDY